jgi:hypothetical protein
MADELKTITIEDAHILFRNFAGKEGKYNRAGERSFCVLLTDTVAEPMLRDGWNVRYLNPSDEGELPTPYVQVSVGFNNRPPRIILLTSTTRTQLEEPSVEILDWADIRLADLIIRGYEWSVNGKSGIKAYLQSLFVTIEEDELEKKYKIHDNPPTQYE